jgi:hypothetical protein
MNVNSRGHNLDTRFEQHRRQLPEYFWKAIHLLFSKYYITNRFFGSGNYLSFFCSDLVTPFIVPFFSLA